MNANTKKYFEQLNRWGKEGVPFLFVIDFEMQKPFACRLKDAAASDVWYDLQGVSNIIPRQMIRPGEFVSFPIDFDSYKDQFDYVSDRLRYGDSFLTNLTIRTAIKTDRSIADLLQLAKAKYRLLFKNEFLVFSPETFVRIQDGKIYTNPMKGTIDAGLPDAKEHLLKSVKELSEHVTIVDLLRNDISQVATNVNVKRFRYVEEIKTTRKNLFQMSSEITGQLPDGFEGNVGDILEKLLPAGSVSGAPKPRTLKIIKEAEGLPRGFYTGVFGYFDGKNLDSGVMIRFIENSNGELFYRSGGGITTQSKAIDEYQEAIDKIYVPID